jgi:hypothetical protein
MKFLLLSGFLILSVPGMPQNLQLYYDFRHIIDPKLNSKNYSTFNFEYFKDIDTISSGSFLLSDDNQIQFYPTVGLKYQF